MSASECCRRLRTRLPHHLALAAAHSYHLALSAALRQCITRHVEWDRNLDPEAVRKFVARMGNLAAHESYDEFLMMLPV